MANNTDLIDHIIPTTKGTEVLFTIPDPDGLLIVNVTVEKEKYSQPDEPVTAAINAIMSAVLVGKISLKEIEDAITNGTKRHQRAG